MHAFTHLVLAACVGLAAMASPATAAEDYPNRPVRFVVPYQTGGLPDVLARLLGQKVSAALGQGVVVDNRSGASGIIAAEHVSGSAADGYTIFVADIAHYAINPALQKNLSYDPGRDFRPVIAAVHGPLLLVVNASVPVNTVPEFLAYAKANPGKVNYGSPGEGSVHHLAMAQLALESKVPMSHIPYRSNAQAVPGLLANDVQAMFISPPSVLEHVKSGRLKVLAVASAEPTPLAPGVPTVASAGFPGFVAVTTIGFLAPAATPPQVITVLNRELGKALDAADVKARLPAMGVTVVAGPPSAFAERMRADQAYYKTLVQRIGLKAN
jgi:tripartite-type tricarboxylate transporter receptor subunit TctC